MSKTSSSPSPSWSPWSSPYNVWQGVRRREKENYLNVKETNTSLTQVFWIMFLILIWIILLILILICPLSIDIAIWGANISHLNICKIWLTSFLCEEICQCVKPLIWHFLFGYCICLSSRLVLLVACHHHYYYLLVTAIGCFSENCNSWRIETCPSPCEG